MADATKKTTAVNALQLDGEVKIDESTVTALLKDSSGNLLLASGTSVPGDTTAYTYARGCQFILTNTDTSVSSLYENIGATTAPTFVPSGGYSVTRTAVTAANIKDLLNYPTTIVEAKGDGSVVIVEDFSIRADCSAVPYVGTGAADPRPYLAYGASTPAGGIKITNAIESVFTGKSEIRFAHIKANSFWGDLTAAFSEDGGVDKHRIWNTVTNTPVVICSTTTGFDVGTGTATITTRYRVVYL